MAEEKEKKAEVKELTLETAFNLLVSLSRNTKLNYQEHIHVDEAVKMVHTALNEYDELKKKE